MTGEKFLLYFYFTANRKGSEERGAYRDKDLAIEHTTVANVRICQ